MILLPWFFYSLHALLRHSRIQQNIKENHIKRTAISPRFKQRLAALINLYIQFIFLLNTVRNKQIPDMLRKKQVRHRRLQCATPFHSLFIYYIFRQPTGTTSTPSCLQYA
ncbi:MAG: hypothetical protein LUH58_07895, partial [Lachnospiraceae bacterium]|nr:hypothetical protein [Lachnospiraceae bacterium]